MLFCIATFSKDKFPRKEVQFFVIAFVFLYSFSVDEKRKNAMLQEIKARPSVHASPYDFELKEGVMNIPNLSHYKFLNSNLDSIKLSGGGEYIIVETWNEKCIPCLRAMEEMRDFYKEMETKASLYHVYIPAKRNIDYPKVFSFEKIKKKHNILVDINLQKDAQLKGYPAFLVFDKSGNLVFSQIGYSSNKKKQLQDGILKAIQ